MAVINEHAITKLIPTKKNTVISLIMTSFILAIANSSNLQFADAQKSSDEPNIEFIEQFGTSGGDDARGVFVDSSGGVYVVGIVGGEFPGQTNEGGEFDAFIRKYNSDGDEEWTRQFGTSEVDFANGVSADSSGGVYVVGSTFGTFPGQTNVGGQDAFLAKFATDDEDKKKHDGDSHDKKKHNDHDAEKKH